MDQDFQLFDLSKLNGWIFNNSSDSQIQSQILKLGRSNYTKPWSDPYIHYHSHTHELYLLSQGEFKIIVNNVMILMKGLSLLLVQPKVPHILIGGTGTIQHYMMRLPVEKDDKIITKKIGKKDIQLYLHNFKEQNAMLDKSLGFYSDLNKLQNCNKWLLGKNYSYNAPFTLGCISIKDGDLTGLELIEEDDEYDYKYILGITGSIKTIIKDLSFTVTPHQLLRLQERVKINVEILEQPLLLIIIRISSSSFD